MFHRRGLIRWVGLFLVGLPRSPIRQIIAASTMVWCRRVIADELPTDRQSDEIAANKLHDQLDRLAKRSYAEEGIPMFLACSTNLAGTPSGDVGAIRLESNRAIVQAFDRCVALLPQIRTAVTEDDVAKLVEFLADEDLKAGGRSYAE